MNRCMSCGKTEKDGKKLMSGVASSICEPCAIECGAAFERAGIHAVPPPPEEPKASGTPVPDEAVSKGAVVLVPPSSFEPYPTAAAIWSAIAPYLDRGLRVARADALRVDREQGDDYAVSPTANAVLIFLEPHDPS